MVWATEKKKEKKKKEKKRKRELPETMMTLVGTPHPPS